MASAVTLSMAGVKGVHPWLVTKLQYEESFTLELFELVWTGIAKEFNVTNKKIT